MTKAATAVVFLNKKTKVHTKEVIFLEGNINYTIVHFEQRSPLIIAITLKKAELLLKDYGFMRVHKSFILNMNYVDSTLLNDTQTIAGKNINIKISRRKRNELKERLSEA